MRSTGPEDTRRIAAELARSLEPGTVIALHGELGAGKTCFIQGLAEGLAVTVPVTSPTYTLVNEYRGRLPLYHIDLYRIRAADEALGLGLDEYLDGGGVTAMEWAERAEALVPPDALVVELQPGPDPESREIRVSGGPPALAESLEGGALRRRGPAGRGSPRGPGLAEVDPPATGAALPDGGAG